MQLFVLKLHLLCWFETIPLTNPLLCDVGERAAIFTSPAPTTTTLPTTISSSTAPWAVKLTTRPAQVIYSTVHVASRRHCEVFDQLFAYSLMSRRRFKLTILVKRFSLLKRLKVHHNACLFSTSFSDSTFGRAGVLCCSMSCDSL